MTQNGDDEIEWQEFATVIKQSMEEAQIQVDREIEDVEKAGKGASFASFYSALRSAFCYIV
eukprot:COSAG03_NODE_5851_length_1161_cov_726.943651_2_plen_61_part_00